MYEDFITESACEIKWGKGGRSGRAVKLQVWLLSEKERGIGWKHPRLPCGLREVLQGYWGVFTKAGCQWSSISQKCLP